MLCKSMSGTANEPAKRRNIIAMYTVCTSVAIWAQGKDISYIIIAILHYVCVSLEFGCMSATMRGCARACTCAASHAKRSGVRFRPHPLVLAAHGMEHRRFFAQKAAAGTERPALEMVQTSPTNTSPT